MTSQNPDKTAKSQMHAYECDNDETVIASNLSTHFRRWDDTTTTMSCVTDHDMSSDEDETWSENKATSSQTVVVPFGGTVKNKTREKWKRKIANREKRR